MASYFMLLTATGAAKMTAANAGGPPLQIVDMAFGDGGGSAVTPTENRAALLNEVHRRALTSLQPNSTNASWMEAETVIPADVGGWWIREVGLIDADGDLVAYGSFADSYKPMLSEGSGKELVVRTIMVVSSASSITMIVNSSIAWATQAWVMAQSFATQAWVAARGYATQAWVDGRGYATQAWVGARGYATQLWVDAQGFATQAWVTGKGYLTNAGNLGGGEGQVFSSKDSGELKLRSIKAGSNVTVSQTANEIIINGDEGVTAHGALTGLENDDHPQYLTAARGASMFAPASVRNATASSGQVRIPCGDDLDWMLQSGTSVAPSSGTYSTSKSIAFASPFKAGVVPVVTVTPITPNTLNGPIVAAVTAIPTATGFTAIFDVAEGASNQVNINYPVNFMWSAQGPVDNSGWLSGAAITWAGQAGSPATATINVTSGVHRLGDQSVTYAASSFSASGIGGVSETFYLYYNDPNHEGGTKTLVATSDPAAPFGVQGSVIVGQVTVTYPASGSGSGGGDTGGGGGGGWCVSTEAFVIGRAGLLRAGDVAVGDELLLCDPETGIESWGVVTYSETNTVPGVRIETDSATLTCSTTAPIPTDAGYVLAPETAGRTVSVRDIAGDIDGRVVGAVHDVAMIDVQHITVGDQCFWASDDGASFILHHNLKNNENQNPV